VDRSRNLPALGDYDEKKNVTDYFKLFEAKGFIKRR
jgi:hypothetical protein